MKPAGSKRAAARVLVVGIGGLGSPAAMALAKAGIGTLGIADDDTVDLTNLHRQVLFDESDVGAPKVQAARQRLLAWAPGIEICVHPTRLLPTNAVDLVSSYDLVVEGSDNFATKFLTADACALARVPVVHAAAVRWHGTVLAVGRGGRPCYRCVFEDLPTEHAPNCAEAGVMGPVVGIVGALQADLALALLDEGDAGPSAIAGTLVTFDGKTDELRRRALRPRRSCALCGASPTIAKVDASRYIADAEC